MLKLFNKQIEPDFVDALNTRVPRIVRVTGTMHEDETSPSQIVLTGRVDPTTLRFLKVDQTYQRPLSERSDIFIALKNGVVVPSIDIGVRGQDFDTEGDTYLIRSPAYIIDGWQRVGNALRLLDLIPDHPITILATVHFGTDDVWERHRFTELNKNIKKISPNLHLRNMRDSNPAVLTLYGLCHNDKNFVLHGKVNWSQNMKRGEILAAFQIVRVARQLHAHLTSLHGNSVNLLAERMNFAAQKAGLNNFRKNVSTFFDVIEECWGIRNIEFRKDAPQVKLGFMMQLARMFSSHVDFWDASERAFFVSANARHKLAKFPITDPHIKSLASSSGSAGYILYDLIIKHMDSGKRIGQLRPRARTSVAAPNAA